MAFRMLALSSPSANPERGLLIALLFGVIDVVLMGAAAYHSNSLTLLSDWLKETTDLMAIVASYITLLAVKRNANSRFGYGIGKLENLVSLLISLTMIGFSFFILSQAYQHLLRPEHAENTIPGLLLLIIYALIGLWIWWINQQTLKQHDSPIIRQQAAMWRSKAMLDATVAITLLLNLIIPDAEWTAYLDPLASLIGVGFMLHAAWSISSTSVNDLLDATLSEQSQFIILKRLVEHFDAYEQFHGVRTRRSGSKVYVEIFLGFNPEISMGEAQNRIDLLRKDLAMHLNGAQVTVVPTRSVD